MKALFVSHSTNLSGASKSFLDVITGLKNRIEITVLVNEKEGVLNDKLTQMGIRCIYVSYGWMVSNRRSNIVKSAAHYLYDMGKYFAGRADKRIINTLKNENYDFIYSNTSVIDIGAVLAHMLSIPHFWHIREFGKEDFDFINIRSKEYRKNLMNQACKLITVSEALKKKYLEIVPEDKICVVHNGFHFNAIEKKKDLHKFGETINILITGQVCEAKGQKEAIMAIESVIRDGYHVELFVAGGVDKSYINPVLKNCSNYIQYIHLLGKVEDMYELRNKMDIELVCSRSEAFGRVTIEAMAHSIPVIGSNRGGTSELIKNEETGLLYECGDIKALAACIKRLIDDKELYHLIMKNAFAYASGFTIDTTVNRLMTIFNTVI